MITVNASKTLHDLDKILGSLESSLEAGLTELALMGQHEAQSKTKGTLAKSIKVEQGKLSRVIFPDQPYATFVENGRKGMVAKNGHFLHFVINGRSVYTKKVKGTKPKPFMKPSYALVNKKAKETLEKHIKRIL